MKFQQRVEKKIRGHIVEIVNSQHVLTFDQNKIFGRKLETKNYLKNSNFL